jgi:hypothetical protein
VEYDPTPLSAINFVIRSRKLFLVDSTPINFWRRCRGIVLINLFFL